MIFYRSVCHDSNERCDKCRCSRRTIGRRTFPSSEPEKPKPRTRSHALTRSGNSFVSFFSLLFYIILLENDFNSFCVGFTSRRGAFKRRCYVIQSKDCVFTRRLSRRRATLGEDPIETIETKTRGRQVARGWERRRRRERRRRGNEEVKEEA